ncbi:MAG: SLC13 family permease [Candidatus Bathyarchaeia archaeon]
MKKKLVMFLSITLFVYIFTSFIGLSYSQIASLLIFIMLISSSLLFWRFRVAFAFIGISALLGLGLLDIDHLIEFASLDVILFLISMMIIIGFLEENAFFEYLIGKIVKAIGLKSDRLIIIILALSAFFAALVDEVTSILFITSTIFHLTSKYKVNPVPFVIMAVFATNIGSSATVVGNPVGVMIALKAGLSFMEFIRWATPIALIALIVIILICRKLFSKDIKKLDESMKMHFMSLEEDKPKAYSKDIMISLGLFLGLIALLIAHNQIEKLLHLKKNTMLLGSAIGIAGIALLIDWKGARLLIETRVDWWTISFFMMFFASVGTLESVGITELIAKSFIHYFGNNENLLLIAFTWIAAIMSAFMDNVLAVTTLIPIVHELSALGVQAFPFWWNMLFAATFFGNLTIIGSTANIVAIGMLERQKGLEISFMDWLKLGAVVSIPTLILANLLIYIQIPFMG